MRTLLLLLLLLFLFVQALPHHLQYVLVSCDQIDHNALISFNQQISSSSSPLNWSSTDCCNWEGITCNDDDHHRVTHLSLSGKGLFGTITPFLVNLTFLSHLNLSHNHLYSSPTTPITLPLSIQTLDLSTNLFNESSSWFLPHLSKLINLNVSNNEFTGPIPSSICSDSPLVEILDFSTNKFNGNLIQVGKCSRLKILRAGFNNLTGKLPNLYNVKTLQELSLPNNHFTGNINIGLLPNLVILELQVNELTGEIPRDIGLLSKLRQLQLHTNTLNGTLPSSLTNCSNLTTLLLRNNLFEGEISTLDFSKLQRLSAVDLGNNSFVGKIPESLCLCRWLTAVRLAYNQLVGELPPCVSSLTSLAHLSLSDNKLVNLVGALNTLVHCKNLAVLFLSRCFNDEKMPDDNDLARLTTTGFQNLQIFTLGGCGLEGKIPLWISQLRKVKVLNLSYNKITGTIPCWLGDMPNLFVLNFTKNFLSGELPREIGRLPALISDNTSTDLSSLALPFLFDSFQYNRLFNLPRGLKVGFNNLSGVIPQEIGQLTLLHILDLNDNNFHGTIPGELSNLVNLERLDVSGNNLSGEIPISLEKLSFLSSFSVANNDLQGEIPIGGQLHTFSATSFEGNPKLCGLVVGRNCTKVETLVPEEEGDDEWESNVPFGLGYFVGFFAVTIPLIFCSSWRSARVVVTSSYSYYTRTSSMQ